MRKKSLLVFIACFIFLIPLQITSLSYQKTIYPKQNPTISKKEGKINMLTIKQIEQILENKISELGMITGLTSSIATTGIFGVKSETVGSMLGAAAEAAMGARIGSQQILIDYKNDLIKIRHQDLLPQKTKEYFNNSLIHESFQDEIYYAVGVKGSGFFNLNPCVLEIVLKQNDLAIFAYAKEGLIKQNTCLKAINMFEKRVFGLLNNSHDQPGHL